MTDDEITQPDLHVPAEVRCVKNGPYLVVHCSRITDAEGNVSVPKDGKVYLCACGQSKQRPFCDGSHRKVENGE